MDSRLGSVQEGPTLTYDPTQGCLLDGVVKMIVSPCGITEASV
jgi:hypothetical protein